MKLQTLVFSGLVLTPSFAAVVASAQALPIVPPRSPSAPAAIPAPVPPALNPEVVPKGYKLQTPGGAAAFAPGDPAGAVKYNTVSDSTTTDMPNPEVVFLTGLPVNGTQEALEAYLFNIRSNLAEISDGALRHIIRITLARIEGEPKDAAAIRVGHLKRLAAYFYIIAGEAQKNKDAVGMTKAIRIAVQCDPAHINARKRFAEILAGTGQKAHAINTLSGGLRSIKLDAPDAVGYVQYYFDLLESARLDKEIIRTANEFLPRRAALSSALCATLALNAAVACNWLGNYEEARSFIRDNALDSFHARMADARACFYGGDTAGAVKLLYKAAPLSRGTEREALLAQIVRFYAETGKWESALSIASQRVTEFPLNPQARLHRLWLLQAAGKQEDFKREAQELLVRYSDDNAVLTPIGMIAGESANPALVEKCRRLRVSAPRAEVGPNVLDSLYVEALIRGKQPREAIEACQQRKLTEIKFVQEHEGTTNALLSAAYFQLGDEMTARRYLEAFLIEEADAASQVRIRDLIARRDGTTGPDVKSTDIVPTVEEMRSINEEIQRLSSRPRRISENTYLAVGKLLRFVNAPQDALRVLEQGIRAHRTSSQLKADSISARLALKISEKSGQHKELLSDIEKLLNIRRPNPRIWAEISKWLNTNPAIAADPKTEKLRPIVAKLVRPDFYVAEPF